MESLTKTILVTGITGFLGSQVCFECLSRNFNVKGTVRNKNDQKKLKVLEKFPNSDKLQIFEADLQNDKGWDEATQNCDYVIHVASPFPIFTPKNENDLIKPAVEGTLRVLKYAKLNKVKKIVITSSVAAMISLHHNEKEINEESWSDLKKVNLYSKSKTMAENAAWSFYKTQDIVNKLEMTVINPGLILGPTLVETDFTSGKLIVKILRNQILGIPKVYWGIVDVRDCAIAHINSLERPESNGQRFVCVSEGLWMEELIKILGEKYIPLGYKLPSHTVWKSTLWFASVFSKEADEIYPRWNYAPIYRNEKSILNLGLKYRPARESLLEMANSLIQFGFVPDKTKSQA